MNFGDVFRINGVKVELEYSQWSFVCRKRNVLFDTGQENCKSRVLDFELTSKVMFEEIPLQWHHENTSRFWVIQDSLHCDGAICWNEMLYPFWHDLESGDDLSYVTQWAFLLSIIAMIVLIITKHSW